MQEGRGNYDLLRVFIVLRADIQASGFLSVCSAKN